MGYCFKSLLFIVSQQWSLWNYKTKKYFSSTDKEERTHMDRAAERMEKSKERTYQWLHTQVWDYEETTPRNEKW